ncbi:MAG: division/cell wall cluster transcriptional repressor MraZ [Eubacteriales bacterium]|nr:division/cell wall cluster transcriptional repressor MraZ [Eubacteriales bacterium]
MFMGSYDHSLDAKGRVIIPSKFRETLGQRFVIAKSLDPCLCVYDSAAWERFEQKLARLPYNTSQQRQIVRFFMSTAEMVEPDKQGRILIPQKLRAHAHIEKNVILMGVGARIEIWDPETFEASGFSDDINEIAGELLGNGFEI